MDNQQLKPLKQVKYGYLYITTNLIDGKKYVGVHKYNKNKLDESYKGSGKYLKRAIDKYGWDNFKTEIIEWFDTKEEMFEAEYNYIKDNNCISSNEYYNIHEGGHGGVSYINLPKEEYDMVIEKISKSKGNRPRTPKELKQLDDLHKSMVGRHHSEESKQKSRQSNLGQKRSETAKLNMSKNHANVCGKNNPAYGRKWINNGEIQLYIKDPELSQKLSDGFVYGKLKKK